MTEGRSRAEIRAERELAVRKLVKKDYCTSEIADELGVAIATVRNDITRMGLAPRHGKQVTRSQMLRAANTEKVRKLAAEGLTCVEIAARIGLVYDAVRMLAKDAGIEVQLVGDVENPRHAKVREMVAAGATVTQMSRRLMTTRQTIANDLKKLGLRPARDTRE